MSNEEKKGVPPEQDTTQPQSESRNLPEANFLQLAFLFGMQAMQCLGLVPHPVSQKAEVDIPLAKFNIDLLEMLQQKTQGNLTPEEEK